MHVLKSREYAVILQPSVPSASTPCTTVDLCRQGGLTTTATENSATDSRGVVGATTRQQGGGESVSNRENRRRGDGASRRRIEAFLQDARRRCGERERGERRSLNQSSSTTTRGVKARGAVASNGFPRKRRLTINKVYTRGEGGE